MVSIRPGRCYTRVKRAYTRKSKFKKLSYVRSVPVSKIVKFDYGDLQRTFPVEVSLLTRAPIQLRHNAIESARMVVIRGLVSLGKDYRFKIRVYPHQILRENRMIAGAGADRMQTGMAHSFGKAVGLAARMKKGKEIFSIYIEPESIPLAKKALQAATYRLPMRTEIRVTKTA